MNDKNPPNLRPTDALDYFAKEIKLDEEQVKKFKELRKAFFFDSKLIRDSLHENKKQILNLVFEGNKDTAKLNLYSDAIAIQQKRIEIMLYNHFSEFDKILTEKQRPEFKKFLKEVLEKDVKNNQLPPPEDGPPPPGDRPPPPGDRPPPPHGDRPPPPPED